MCSRLKISVVITIALIVACSDGVDVELGTCTITGFQAPVVMENFGFGDCQQLFPTVPGATTMKWEPN